jgi:hypothetical protein
MFILDPGSWFLPIPDPGSRIPDPKTATKERGEKKLPGSCHTFLCSHKFQKIILVFKCWRKKFGPIFKEYRTFYPKNCQKGLKNMVLGSGIRDPGSRGQKGTGSRIRIRNTALYSFIYRRAWLCTFQIAVDFYYDRVGRERGVMERKGGKMTCQMALVMDFSPSKPLRTAPYK